MDGILLQTDALVILLYRITGNPLWDYFIGTLLLALLAVAVGEVSVRILRHVNSSHMQRLDTEMSDKHSMSVAAKKAGDEESYRVLNKEANDAFGRVFFNMFTFSAASLWPALLALAWMQSRFMAIEFPLPFKAPLFGDSVGYAFTFVLIYILCRILLNKFRNRDEAASASPG